MSKTEYIGTNKGLNFNPADLHVYRKKQYSENTTPADKAYDYFTFLKHYQEINKK
jgi:hypothetical protein